MCLERGIEHGECNLYIVPSAIYRMTVACRSVRAVVRSCCLLLKNYVFFLKMHCRDIRLFYSEYVIQLAQLKKSLPCVTTPMALIYWRT